MKHHTILYVFNTYERAEYEAKKKLKQLEEEGYVYEWSQAGLCISIQLSDMSVLRLEFAPVADIDAAYRQHAGRTYFAVAFQEDAYFTGKVISFLLSRKREESPKSEPVRRGSLWQVINLG